jgi:uncharacterized protein (DUF849 family)
MIIQACLNGNRDETFHPAVPLTMAQMVDDALATVAAGAAEIHLHPRDKAGRETLHPDFVDETIYAVRQACPGTLVGISTADWIERDDRRRYDYLRSLSVLPDHASVNFADADCANVVEALRHKGIGIEAGLATAADARRFLDLGLAGVLRILIEIASQDARAAWFEQTVIEGIVLAPLRKPILLHGCDTTVWRLVDTAFASGYSTRVGFEDGRLLPDGRVAPSNAAIVAAAVERLARRQRAIGE